MRIDLYKLIVSLLPIKLRQTKFIDLIRALVGQVQYAFNQFMQSTYDYLYEAHANASTISLEHHINREFDVKATITELDGKPYDFLITIDGYVDEYTLKAFIDKWKLAGKSYTFRQGAVTFTAAFTNYRCENLSNVFTAAFSDYVCEDDRVNTISAVTENISDDENPNFQLTVSAKYPVKSVLHIYGVTYFTNNGNVTNVNWEEDFAVDQQSTVSSFTPESGSALLSTVITLISPDSDDYYDYKKAD